MHFRQILHEDLGCASYLIADRGEAAVVDPKWDVGEYLDEARKAGALIRHVLETHNHADHVSGRCRLAAVTGARIHIPRADGHDGLVDGDSVSVGELELAVLATPGHRPEHISYLVRRLGNDQFLLSGDSLLVGGLARPDLAVPAQEGALGLWETVGRLKALGDDVEVWPAHVGGSLCTSGHTSSATSSTIGDERRSNPLLSIPDLDAFTSELTRCIPARPPTVERVIELNRRGAVHPGPVRELDASALGQFVGAAVCVVDVREPASYDAAHLAGSLNLPASGRGLGTRAGWAVGADRPIVVVAPSRSIGCRVVELLHAAGLWNVAGLTVAEPIAWAAAGLPVGIADALTPGGLVPRLREGTVTVVDVRDPAEWSAGHLAQSRHVPLSQLGDGGISDVPDDVPIAVVCASGLRAALAASILRRRGHERVARVTGGVDQIARLGSSWVGGRQ